MPRLQTLEDVISLKKEIDKSTFASLDSICRNREITPSDLRHNFDRIPMSQLEEIAHYFLQPKTISSHEILENFRKVLVQQHFDNMAAIQSLGQNLINTAH